MKKTLSTASSPCAHWVSINGAELGATIFLLGFAVRSWRTIRCLELESAVSIIRPVEPDIHNGHFDGPHSRPTNHPSGIQGIDCGVQTVQ